MGEIRRDSQGSPAVRITLDLYISKSIDDGEDSSWVSAHHWPTRLAGGSTNHGSFCGCEEAWPS